ncbi:MAG: M1 family aminopeptidase [Myxococcota bacterium]
MSPVTTCVLALALLGFPGAPRQADLLHQRVDLVVDIAARELRGSTTLSLAPLRADLETLVLDGAGLTVEGASVDGADAAARVRGDTVVITLPRARPTVGKPFQVTLRYRTRPQRGFHFQSNGAVPAFTQNQPHLTRFWLPTVDTPQERATYELAITVPAAHGVHGSGALISDETVGHGQRRVTRRLDVAVPPYLLSVVVGQLKEVPLTTGEGGPHAVARVPAGREKDAQRAFAVLPRVLQTLQRWTGVAYPFPTLELVVVDGFPFQGMENAAAPTVDTTVLPEASLDVEDADRNLWVHELAHQWFGVLTVVGHERDLWMQEGLAGYLAHLVEEELRDPHEARADLLEESLSPPADDQAARALDDLTDDDPEAAFDSVTYGRGALMFHVLRARLGDAAFSAVLRLLLTEQGGGVMDRDDLLRALHAVTGVAHESLLDSWTAAPGEPGLQVELQEEPLGRGMMLRLEQADPPRPVFTTVTLGTARGEVRLPLWSTSREAWLALPGVTGLQWMVIDDEQWLPAPPPSLPSQLLVGALQHAREPHTRAAAARALKGRHDGETRQALLHALKTDPNALVREGAALALGEATGPDVTEALTAALKDPNHRVQRAAATGLCGMGDVQTARALARLAGAPGRMAPREAAAFSLGCHVRDAPDLVERALKLKSAGARVEASVLYGVSTREPEHALLVDALQRGSPPLARAAADTIAPSATRATVVYALARRLVDADHAVRQSAAEALQRLHAVEALPALRAAEQTESVGPTRHAMRRAIRELTRPTPR